MWASALIGDVLLAVAVTLATLGRRRFALGFPPFKATAATIRDDITELKSRASR